MRSRLRAELCVLAIPELGTATPGSHRSGDVEARLCVLLQGENSPWFQPLPCRVCAIPGGWVGRLGPRALLATLGTAQSSYKAFIKQGGAGFIRPG